MTARFEKQGVDGHQIKKLWQQIAALESELQSVRQESTAVQQALAATLRHRILFEQLVRQIATRFARSSVEEAGSLLTWALEHVCFISGAQRGYIFALNGRTIHLIHQWHTEDTPPVTPKHLFPTEPSDWWRRFFSRRAALHLPAVTSVDDQATRQVLLDSGIQSLLLIPLVQHGRFYGFLGFDTVTHAHHWAEADITLLQVVGELFVAVLDKEAKEKRSRIAEDIGQMLTQLLEPDELVSYLTTELNNKLGYYYAQIFLVHSDFFLRETLPASERLVLYQGSGEIGKQLVAARHSLPLAAEKSLVALAARTGKTVVANNAQKDERFLPNALLSETKAEITIPLLLESSLLGVLDIQCKQTNVFNTAEQRILHTIASHLAIALSNARLFTRNRRLLKEVRALHAIATAEADDQDTLIQQTTALVGEMLYPRNFGVRLVQPDGSLRDHPSYRAKKHTVDNQLVTPPGAGITGQVATTGQPIRCGDVRQIPNYIAINEGIRSELCVPIKIDGRVIGVINTESPELNAFNEADERLLTTLAGQLSASLARLDLIHKLQSRASQRECLTEAAGTIASALDERQLWDALQEAAAELLDAPYTAVYLYNPAGKTINCPYARGVSSKFINNLNRHFSTMPDGEAIRENMPIIVNHVATDDRVAKMRHMLQEEGIGAYGVFPLPSSPQTAFGAIVHYRLDATPFSDNDIHAGTTLGHVTAVALQNVRLFSEMSRALSRERNLNQLTRTLSGTRDLPTILANIIQQAAELVEADAGLLGLVIDNQIMTFYPVNLPDSISLRPLARNQSLAWHITDTGESVRLEQYENHAHAQRQWQRAGAKAYLGVPIYIGEDNLGTIEMFQLESEKRFTERDQRILESVGRQAGIAIQNARLFIEAEQRTSALASALAKQEELDQLKNAFIQNVSHELRTPLGIIYGHAELLFSNPNTNLNEGQEQSLEIIVRRTRMLADLVEDLSALLAAETQDFRREQISPSQLLYSMMADYRMQAEEIGLELTSEIAEDLPMIQGDPTHLRRVFDNLVSNAFKYTDPGGSIALKVWAEQSQVFITVSDTGTGINQEYLHRIFERFFQITDGTTPRKKGTGLGLALVKEIVEAHRGYVSVRSQPGEGTTFEIMLPASQTDSSQAG